MKRLDHWRWAALAAMAVAGWFNFRYMFDFAMAMFASPIEDMSHGWLVPVFSLYVLVSQRRELRAAAGGPSWAGAAWVLLFLALTWLGGRGGQTRIEQVAFIGLVWSVPYAFWGPGVERRMRFPAAFLAFTIPVSSFVDLFTIHLRIFSSAMATGILNGLGVAVERSGTALYSLAPGAAFKVDVADPCSGVRSLFAMMALTAAYAHFTQKTRFRKLSLFACSLPVAMIGNMVRIMSICLVAVWLGQETATGYYHDYSGYVVFVVGVLLMVQAGELLQRYAARAERLLPGWWSAGEAPLEAGRGAEASRRSAAIVASVCLASVCVFIGNRTMPEPAFGEASFIAPSLPERVGEFTGDVPWFCHNAQCLAVAGERELKGRGEPYRCLSCGGELSRVSLGESTDLPKDTVIVKRSYRSTDGLVYSVNLVIGGRNRSSIHRAELCLPAQGYVMLDAGRVSLALGGGRSLTARAISLSRKMSPPQALVYWFVSEDRELCSHTQRILLDVWDRSVHNRINRWVMVAVNLSAPLDTPESRSRFEAFLAELYPQIFPDR